MTNGADTTAAGPAGRVAAMAREQTALRSIRNAATLGGSLVLTWGVALGVRLVLPRHLGPERFGEFQFADGFATVLLIATNLGIETYVRKEIAARPGHASEFLGGIVVLRLLLSVALLLAAVLALGVAGKPVLVRHLVMLLATAQIFIVANGTLAALLHAVGVVGGLSLLNVGSKVLWGAGIFLALAFGGGVEEVAIALLLSEMLKTAGLLVLTRRHLSLRLAIDARATSAVIAASLPFYLASLSATIYSRIDITFVSFLAGDVETGWYGAASSVAGMAMLLAPLIWWVLLPMSAHAEARSEDDLNILMRRAMEFVLAAAIPMSLLLGLGADVVIRFLFGDAFVPATGSLRVLAPMFVLTYANMVSSSILVRLGRGWTVTLTLLAGMALSPVLNWLLIPRAAGLLGPGGAGVGAGMALVLTEAVITISLTARVGSRVFDRAGVNRLGRTALVCALVVAADRLLAPLGSARLAADAVLYVLLAVALQAIDHKTLFTLTRRALGRREPVHVPAI